MTASPGGMTRALTDGQLRLMTRVARMYHERGVRQVRHRRNPAPLAGAGVPTAQACC